jgi:hypothetical protein
VWLGVESFYRWFGEVGEEWGSLVLSSVVFGAVVIVL